MTFETKIDAPLAERMLSGSQEALPVLIEMSDQPEAPQTLDRGADIDSLIHQTEASQGGIRSHLHDLGVSDDAIEAFSIVNALATTLTPDQIRALAARDDVRFIRYNGQANVAL